MQIYAKNYEILYLTFESAGLVAPSPLLIEDVHLVPGEMVEGSESAKQAAPGAPQAAPVAPVAH
jgi:hypothetical protein